MDKFTNHQLLLMQVRDFYCKGKAAELARRIGKDGTYVHRLFYPIGKKGGKGVGLEIMTACSTAFDLPPGYWEGQATYAPPHDTKATENKPTSHAVGAVVHIAEPVPPSPWAWPFKDVKPAQYALLDDQQRTEVENYILFKIRNREPPEKLTAPETNSAKANAA